MKKGIAALLFSLLCTGAIKAQSIWTDSQAILKSSKQVIQPAKYRSLNLDVQAIAALMASAPSEAQTFAKTSPAVISLPLPDGSFESFRFVESSIMAPELQAKFPEIRTYLGQGVDNPSHTVRFDLTPKGFHAMILRPSGTVYIDPVASDMPNAYMSYYKADFYKTTDKLMNELPPVLGAIDADKFEDAIHDGEKPGKGKKKPAIMGLGSIKTPTGAQLRTYRLALACTGEYAQFHGGTVALTMAAMVTSMNRVNGVYEAEAAIRMVMVPNNDQIIFLNPSTDPYTNNSGSTMLNQNQTTCDNIIGFGNYDIGHVYSTGGGGIAQLNSPCGSGKARGVTGQPTPVGDPFDIDYVCHEMGHQFGANHTQNNSCNRASSAAFEPGSASTIMGYAGICSPNLQSNSDDYFHNHSYNEIYNFSVNGNGNTCAVITNTGNTPPTVDAGVGGWAIPISTPFELTATGSDADGDAITYNWEQYNLGPATSSGDNNLTNPSGNAPIFRSWPALESPTRVFPRITDLVNNTTVVGEHLPTYSRDMTFRCTVRDNRAGGGGVNDDQVSFTVSDVGGPFLVTAPNTSVTYPGNSFQTITWDVANTTASPINCQNVDIFLSTDGGLTYPTLLVANTPNDGNQTVLIPAGQSNTARIKVKASNNIFFDISNTNFTIGPAIGNIDLDAALVGITSPAGDNCGNQFTPEIQVSNLGQLNLTSFDVNYNVNGGPNSTFSWSGNLATGETVSVTLPGFTSPNGNNVFNVSLSNPNGASDDNPTNDSGSSNFSAVAGGDLVTLTIFTDCWGGEVSWELSDNNGTVLESIAPGTLGNLQTITWDFCLPEGCYNLTINDSFGDGLSGVASGCSSDGNYFMTDSQGNILFQMGAANYGSSVTEPFCIVNNGTPGCTDPSACNFDSEADFDNGTCDYSCFGCTNPAACNFDSGATIDNGSCIFPDGCTDPLACNFDPAALCDNGSCEFVSCAGCTDPLADNFDPNATIDDGSCTFTCVPVTLTLSTDCWGGEVSWELLTDGGILIASVAEGTYGNQQTFTWEGCLPEGCYVFNIFDGFGDGMFGSQYSSCTVDGNYFMTDIDGNVLFQMATPAYGTGTTENFCITIDNAVQGCTNPLACNFDPSATEDNGSCQLPDGCTDLAACNYNPAALCDDGSCILPDGCTDPAACNFDPAAQCDNGSCIQPDGCTDSNACNFNPAATCDDNSCEFTSCAGCTNSAACNFDASASIDDGSCILPNGCTDANACNFDPAATCDDGSCEFVSCAGCTDPNACNFDSGATIDDGSCDLGSLYYPDVDGDGFGAGNGVLLCSPQAGFSDNNTDCDDSNELIYPGAPGTAAGIDNNCNGTIDPEEEFFCLGDLNSDGQVNISDMLLLLGDFGCTGNCVGDIDGNGAVNSGDAITLLGVFGSSCL